MKEQKKLEGDIIQLGGIWEGVEITEEDIKEARNELLRKIEERWERYENNKETNIHH